MNSTTTVKDKYNQMIQHMLFLTPYANPNSGAEMGKESLEEFQKGLDAYFLNSDNEHYLKQHAAYDLISGTTLHGMFISNKRLSTDSFGKISAAKEHPYKLVSIAAESLFDCILQQVGNGHIALFSMFTDKQYGETAMKLDEAPQEVYADLMRHAGEYDGHLLSHIIMHTLLKQGVDNILKHDNYGSMEVYMLSQYVPESVLLRKGGHRLRRHIAENGLSL